VVAGIFSPSILKLKKKTCPTTVLDSLCGGRDILPQYIEAEKEDLS
jgi:hypothetical protein